MCVAGALRWLWLGCVRLGVRRRVLRAAHNAAGRIRMMPMRSCGSVSAMTDTATAAPDTTTDFDDCPTCEQHCDVIHYDLEAMHPAQRAEAEELTELGYGPETHPETFLADADDWPAVMADRAERAAHQRAVAVAALAAERREWLADPPMHVIYTKPGTRRTGNCGLPEMPLSALRANAVASQLAHVAKPLDGHYARPPSEIAATIDATFDAVAADGKRRNVARPAAGGYWELVSVRRGTMPKRLREAS